jgi:hypothetical protein
VNKGARQHSRICAYWQRAQHRASYSCGEPLKLGRTCKPAAASASTICRDRVAMNPPHHVTQRGNGSSGKRAENCTPDRSRMEKGVGNPS